MEEQAVNKILAGAPLGPHRNQTQAVPQLSCELCRTRKIKCDKLQPCTACVSAGANCVPVHRLRLTRGRHVHRSLAVNEDVRRRIRRLEALVSSANPRTIAAATTGNGISGDKYPGTKASPSVPLSGPGASAGPGKNIILMQRPDHFWADLAEEIHGLRDVVESSPDEAEDDTAQTQDAAQANPPGHGIGVLGLASLSASLPVLGNIGDVRASVVYDSKLACQLCPIYVQQVDPIIKILHRPSIEKHLLHGGSYLSYPDGHASVEALVSAVIYCSVSSMTDDQCRRVLCREKPKLLQDCRRSCEAAIEKADLLTTRDMTVLQAFVLYLAGRRAEEQSRAVWTLFSVAVRVAKALSLYLDPDTLGRHETFFVQQMRRRLWLTICLMDIQTSFGMTSQPLVGMDEAVSSFRLPAHINDADFDLKTVDPPSERSGLTDSTYAIIKYRLQHFGRLTNFGASSSSEATKTDIPTAEVRQKLAEELEKDIMTQIALCDPEESAYAWFVFHSAHCFVAGARVTVLRPAQRVPEGGRPPPSRMRGDTELLRSTTDVLKNAMLIHSDPRGEGFRWDVTVRWHAVAIALAECYICTDADLLRSVWPTIEASYQHHEAIIARFRGGKLRGPLAKLMERTRQKLDPVLRDGRPVENTPSPSGRLDSAAEVYQPRPLTPLVPQTVSLAPSSLNNMPLSGTFLSTTDTTSTSDNLDPSWEVWNDFLATITFDEFANFDTQFYE